MYITRNKKEDSTKKMNKKEENKTKIYINKQKSVFSVFRNSTKVRGSQRKCPKRWTKIRDGQYIGASIGIGQYLFTGNWDNIRPVLKNLLLFFRLFSETLYF